MAHLELLYSLAYITPACAEPRIIHYPRYIPTFRASMHFLLERCAARRGACWQCTQHACCCTAGGSHRRVQTSCMYDA